jgi:hypothetical protein
MGFDLWRLFAGVDADHVQFLFLQKYQVRKKQRGGYFDYEFGIYFFIFLFSVKTIMWVTKAKSENHSGQSISFQITAR